MLDRSMEKSVAAIENPIELLPAAAQYIIYASAGVAIGFWAVQNYFVKKKDPQQTSKDVLLTEASIADMSWGRDMAGDVREILKYVRQQVEANRERDDEAEQRSLIEAEVQRRMGEALAKMDFPRQPPRRPRS